MGRGIGVSFGLEPLEARALLTVFAPFDILADQTVLYDLSAPSGTFGFGTTVASLGDLNGDGRPEFAVGAPGRAADGQSGPVEGRVFIYSGVTGGLLGTLGDGSVGFGRAIAVVGDTNGDDVPDFAVGSPEFGDAGGTQGRAWVYSGVDAAVLYSVTGDGPLGELGRAIVGIRDVDGDGIGDIAIGGRIEQQGEVRVVSGATGAALFTIPSMGLGVSFGSSLAGVFGSEIGEPVLAVGAPDDGSVSVYSGTGHLMTTIRPQTAQIGFGVALAASPVAIVASVGAPAFNLGVLSPIGGGPDRYQLELYRVYMDGGVVDDGFSSSPVARGTGLVYGRTRPSTSETFLLPFLDSKGRSGVFAEAVTLAKFGGPALVLAVSATHPSALLGAIALAGDLDADGAQEIITAAPGGGRVTVLRSGPLFSDRNRSAVTRDGAEVYQSPIYGDTYTAHFLIDGRWMSSELVPALHPFDEVVDMAGLSLIVGFEHAVVGGPRGLAFIIRNGVRTRVIDAVTSMTGGSVAANRLVPVRALNDGRIVFTTQDGTSPNSNTAWIMTPDGGLLFLWFGFAADANESGTVVGTNIDAGGVARGVRWDNGVVTDIAGMSGAQAISSDGFIAGWAGADRLVVWDGTALTDMGAINDSIASIIREPGVTFTSSFSVVRITPQRRVLGHLWVTYQSDDGSHGTFDQWFYTDPKTAPTTKLPLLAPTYSQGSFPGYGLTDTGVLIGRAEWNALDDSVLFTARAGESVSVSAGGDRLSTINQYGMVMTFALAGSTWSGITGPFSVKASALTGELVTWIDPVDQETCVMLAADKPRHGLMMVRGMTGSATIADINIGADEPLTDTLHGLTLFHSTDGNVHVFAINGAGKFMLLTRTDKPLADHDAWTVSRISEDDLFFQGLATPAWVSRPAAFVTAWNAFNIAGLDNAGRVQAVWIAPGMRLWNVADLSVISSAPALVGGITAFTTAWGGINVVGTDAAGELTAIWWAPALGGSWLTSSLSAAAGSAITLRAETLTSYVTPWGAMNVAGVDENGQVTIFWWTGATGVWTASTVTADLQQVAAPVGRLSAGVTGAGVVHIGGVGANGHVVDVNWAPGGSWVTDDVTATAV